MKKIVLLLFVMLLLTCLTWAKPITIDQAKQVATNILVERSNFTNPAIVNNSVERDQSGQPLIYIFNFRPASFVMVSAEDNVLPVLGYCLDQTYSESNHPIQFDDLLWSYRGQIEYARTYNLPTTTQITNDWQRLIVASSSFIPLNDRDRDVAPIIQSSWGQGTYYNQYCPGNTPVGCVAVAMGQIMKRWGYPNVGFGSHSYTAAPYGTQTANFGTTNYSWSLMANSLSNYNTYVATLLYHCGVSVNMQYAPGGSGAYDTDAASALTTYFGYKSTLSLKQKSNYTATAWDALMKAEVDANRPVYYSGSGPAGGHAFNLDGYQGSAYPYHFHFNWGWDGYDNGYYLLSMLNPGGETFNIGCEAIIGIEPTGTLNLFEGFESVTPPALPTGWTATASTWITTATTTTAPITTVIAGNYSARYAATATATAFSGKQLITPKLSVVAGNTISFYAKSGATVRGEQVKVKWSTTGIAGSFADFTTAQTTPTLTATATKYTFNIGTYKTGDYYVCFETYSTTATSNAKQIALDTVEGPPRWVSPTPVVGLNTATWGAGNVNIGSMGSSGDNYAITNNAGGTLTITSAIISGTSASKFSTNFDTSTTLQFNTSYAFGLFYEPTTLGADTATLTIVTNGGTVAIALSGTGVYDVINDGFENYTNFATAFSPWTNIDVDQLNTYGITNYTWTNSGAKQAFIIYNPSATVPPISMATHGGAKMAACFAGVPAGAVTHNDDYLITKMLNLVGSTTLSFWYKSYSASYLESFTVLYSTTGNAVANFTNTLTTVTNAPTTWTQYTTATLPITAKYVAIHCISADKYILLVDDFVIHDGSTPPGLGHVEGHIYAYGTTTPIPNAVVSIGPKTATTNSAGYYKINNLLVDTYLMTVTAPGTFFMDATQAGVSITLGNTATQNLGMKWASMTVSPVPITQTLNPYGTADQTLTISNLTGTADLEFDIYRQVAARGSNKPNLASSNPNLSSESTNQKVAKANSETIEPTRSITHSDDRGEGWIDYSFGVDDSYWGGTTAGTYPERAVYYAIDDWGLWQNSITVTQLRHAFYQDSNNVWGTNNTFKFRIYSNDGVTVLYTSPTLTATSSYTSGSLYGYSDLTTYTLPTPMTFTTDFIVAVIVSSATGYPASSCSSVELGYSMVSSSSPAISTSWYSAPWEFTQGVYIAGGEWGVLSSYTGTVAPGASQNITVHFDATNMNGITKSANLIIVNNSDYHVPRGNDFVDPMTLTVNAATTPLPFLNTTTWSSITASGVPASSGSVFTLKNVGIGTLTVSSITSLSSTDFSTTFVPGSVSLTANQTYAFGFTYHPASPGIDSLAFNIVTSNGTVTVILKGYGDYTLEGFEGTNFPPDGWANIDQDADTYKWYAYSATGAPYAGLKCAASDSYMNAKSNINAHGNGRPILTPDNYLITPRLAISYGDQLKYWIGAQDPLWPAEHYSVKLSTTDANTSSFTNELFAETLVDGDWHERTIDLSAYAHLNVYIAFEHHDCTNEFVLKLDNVLYPVLAAPLQYGSLKAQVYKSGTTTPIQNATVTINGLSALTDIDGSCEITNVLVGTYDVTCTKPVGTYYFDQTITGVVITADNQTNQDIYMTWAELGVNPTSFDVTVAAGETTDRNMTISNPGGTANLQYFVSLWDTSSRSESPTIAKSRPVVDRSKSEPVTADVKIQNNHARTYGWYGYADTDDFDYYTWAGTERATKYVIADLGLLRPVTIQKISSFFYDPTPSEWVDATFHFVIYAADGTTVLYTSPDIEAVSLAETEHTLTTPLVVTGDFYVATVQTDTGGSPFTCGTSLYSGNSYDKISGVWTLSTLEYMNYVYAEGAGWLTVTNGSGTVAPLGSAIVGLHFDATGLASTSRSCTIAIYNNSNNTSARGVTREIPVLFTITAGGIATPTGVAINLVGGVPKLTWNPVSGATSYKVYGSDDPYTSNWGTAIASPTAPNYTISSGPLYHFYKITAVSGAKNSNEIDVGKPVSTKK
jgi:hypothetical protein